VHPWAAGWTLAAPEPLTELNGPTSFEYWPTLTPDGLTIYFSSDRGGAGLDIYTATRSAMSSAFGVPQLASGAFNTAQDDLGAVFSDDGLEVIVTRRSTSLDFLLGSRSDASQELFSWRDLTEINSTEEEHQPSFLPGNLRIVWTRGGQVLEAERASRTQPFTNIVASPLTLSGFDVHLAVSGDERIGIVSSNGAGQFDLYQTGRAGPSDPWSTPQPLALNTVGDELSPFLSFDSCQLVFERGQDLFLARFVPP
jgi:Tol biopolymer transport system component